MNKISKLAGETALYGLGSIVPRALNFLLFPLHTRIFNPEDYGVISYLYVFAAFFNIVYTFGMETAYFRFATKEGADPKKIFNIAQTAVISISLCLSLIIIIFADPIAESLTIAGKTQYILWLAAIMFIDGIVAIPFARLRLNKKPLQYAASRIINVVILVGLNLYFFVLATPSSNVTYGIDYVFLANLIANGFYILFFFQTFIAWRPAWHNTISPSMLRYAYPVMLTGLAGMTNEMFSRWTIEWWLPENFYPGRSSMYALGVFSAAIKYAVIMNLSIQAFKFAAEPFFFSNASDKNSPALFARVNHFFVIVTSFILLAVTINMDLLKFLVGGESYYEGLKVVPLLLLGYLFLGVYYNFSVWFKLTDKTYYGTIITLGGVVITVVLNYLWIPMAGYTGSSWATLICYLSMAIACYLLGQKYYPIPYRILSDICYIVFAFILLQLSNQFTFESQFVATSFHCLVLAVYMATAYFIEKRGLRQTLA